MKKLIFVASIFCIFISVVLIGFSYNNFSGLEIFEDLRRESPYSREEFTPLADLSQMFNERGYFKSNGFSFEEQEIINDNNGNLIYDIPLYNYKMANNMSFDVCLTYNGSVGHTVFIGDTNTISNEFSRYNVNSPEWIVSINGIAVQVFNFEVKFFTSTQSDEISGNNIPKLIPGYHFTDRLIAGDDQNRDRINILAGDGSLITLVNTSNSDTGLHVYEGREMYYKAKVYYLESGFGWHRNRRMELMKGDGNIYIFNEYKASYEDFRSSSIVNVVRKPQIMLLEQIIDQFGNRISVSYEGEEPVGWTGLGRPICFGINSPQTPGVQLFYGNYQCLIENVSVASEIKDQQGTSRQIDSTYFEVGDFQTHGYDGSFLIKCKKNLMEGVPRYWTYQYTYFGSPGSNPPETKTETDPLNNRTYIKYDSFYTKVRFQVYGGNFFYYSIFSPLEEIHTDDDHNTTLKKFYKYYHDTTVV